MVRPIVDTGTDEGTWRAWAAPADWPVLALDDRARAVPPLVVAPHPDDEVLGVGGLVAVLTGGVEITVVTDGEASHPDSTVHSRAELAAIRRAETVTACGLLGVVPAAIDHLGQPDGAVDEAALTDALTTRLTPERWCVTTWRGDGHPDHEAVGRAAAVACRRTGATLLEFPVWTWHWATPDHPDVPWHRARRIDLTPAARSAKRRAVDAFRSQVLPLGPTPADAAILPPHVLARFARPYETVFVS
ncbi:PIG-L deacetylase family protein [Micromonospora rifamycinica]|uniref:N-acetylglucosaminyl deacetylase, LmbE family n=1 Tax=Micromonospora rifamycinica TaxID=291594 RepID=A0A109IPF2_9ACTN|nr:PIG-L family deacetylase [Micromonospora rifamycinica]KWV34291.1 GlcNAc-PI de-N-acetylase [Micromonospora rifamycinica]SCG34768.1 N-acetylglucosaminyl deacetylase, LmbE family [Micromonospora rifamycinica]